MLNKLERKRAMVTNSAPAICILKLGGKIVHPLSGEQLFIAFGEELSNHCLPNQKFVAKQKKMLSQTKTLVAITPATVVLDVPPDCVATRLRDNNVTTRLRDVSARNNEQPGHVVLLQTNFLKNNAMPQRYHQIRRDTINCPLPATQRTGDSHAPHNNFRHSSLESGNFLVDEIIYTPSSTI